jgi:hypothetical protein
MRSFRCIVLSVILAHSIACQKQAEVIPPVEVGEYSVIAAVLAEKHAASDTNKVILLDLTCPPPFPTPELDEPPLTSLYQGQASEAAIRDYIQKNSRRFRLAFESDLKPGAIPLHWTTEDTAWARFPDIEYLHRQYPESNGFFIASRVAFNPDQNEALVFMHFYCGPLCGSGALYRLLLDSDGWHVTARLDGYVS